MFKRIFKPKNNTNKAAAVDVNQKIVAALMDENILTRSQMRDIIIQLNISDDEKTNLANDLIVAFTTNQFWPYRNEYVTDVLAKIGNDNTLLALTDVLVNKSGAEYVRARSAAAYAIGKIARQRWNAIIGSEYRNAEQIYSSNDIVDQRSVITLLGCFLLDSQDKDERSFCYFAWNALSEIKCVSILQPLLTSFAQGKVVGTVHMIDASGYEFSRPKKVLALEILGHCGSNESIPVILQSLDDDNGEIRYAAIGALSNLGTPEAAIELEKIRKTHHSTEGIKGALEAIDTKRISFLIKYSEMWR